MESSQTFVTVPFLEWENMKKAINEISCFVRNQKSTLGNDRLLSVKEVAAIVGRTENRVREWIKSGKLEAIEKNLGKTENRKTVMIKESVLNEFLKSEN